MKQTNPTPIQSMSWLMSISDGHIHNQRVTRFQFSKGSNTTLKISYSENNNSGYILSKGVDGSNSLIRVMSTQLKAYIANGLTVFVKNQFSDWTKVTTETVDTILAQLVNIQGPPFIGASFTFSVTVNSNPLLL